MKFQGNIKRLKQNHPYAASVLINLQDQARVELGDKLPFMLIDSAGYETYITERLRANGWDDSPITKRLSKL